MIDLTFVIDLTFDYIRLCMYLLLLYMSVDNPMNKLKIWTTCMYL